MRQIKKKTVFTSANLMARNEKKKEIIQGSNVERAFFC